ncbi:hypothetical protein MAR_003074 [Mya arenaria]|uniref:Uncharacterized protein n=1 Tax=Mya arenaria TaxID=6604 RepID=A0ABY7G907_MYAAR|nr:hypothetical protein MAR_003074 [Mya arenaria]
MYHGVMNEWTVDVDRRIYKGIQVGMDRGFVKVKDPIVIVTVFKEIEGAGRQVMKKKCEEKQERSKFLPTWTKDQNFLMSAKQFYRSL